MLSSSGIYIIENLINRHCYIGSAVNFSKRWSEHRRRLNKNNHHSKYLQNAWNKYGAKSFKFKILEFVKKSELISKEQFYIDTLKPNYNIAQFAGSQLGYKHSVETIEKIRKNMNPNNYWTGAKHTLRSRKKMAEAHGGKPFKVYNKFNEYVGTWFILCKCAEDLDLSYGNICSCLKGKRKQHKGYRFKYV